MTDKNQDLGLLVVIPEVAFGNLPFTIQMGTYFVYILASKKNGVLYTGVTSNLVKRIYEHRNSLVKGFTEKYKAYKLVYFEQSDNIDSAIAREKSIKKWDRSWKIRLIKKDNPDWNDLYEEIIK